MEEQMSAGTIWTIILVGILLLALVGAVIFFAFLMNRGDSDDREEAPKWIAGTLGLIVFVLAGTLYAMWPLKHEYHYWIPKAGVVSSVDNRLVSNGDGTGMETKFVVTFLNDPMSQQYGVTDTRAAGLKVGDTLTITCKREWQFSGTDGYDCNFVEYKPAKR